MTNRLPVDHWLTCMHEDLLYTLDTCSLGWSNILCCFFWLLILQYNKYTHIHSALSIHVKCKHMTWVLHVPVHVSEGQKPSVL